MLRLILLTLLLSIFDSHACSNEKAESFKPYAEMVSATSNLMTLNVFFPVRDGSDQPMYLDSLTLTVPNKLTVELKTSLSEISKEHYQAEMSIDRNLIKDAQLIGSYNYNDHDGKSLSLCANWKSFSLQNLLVIGASSDFKMDNN